MQENYQSDPLRNKPMRRVARETAYNKVRRLAMILDIPPADPSFIWLLSQFSEEYKFRRKVEKILKGHKDFQDKFCKTYDNASKKVTVLSKERAVYPQKTDELLFISILHSSINSIAIQEFFEISYNARVLSKERAVYPQKTDELLFINILHSSINSIKPFAEACKKYYELKKEEIKLENINNKPVYKDLEYLYRNYCEYYILLTILKANNRIELIPKNYIDLLQNDEKNKIKYKAITDIQKNLGKYWAKFDNDKSKIIDILDIINCDTLEEVKECKKRIAREKLQQYIKFSIDFLMYYLSTFIKWCQNIYSKAAIKFTEFISGSEGRHDNRINH